MQIVGFEQRISEAFGGASIPQIAEKMGVNYHTLRNWLKGRTDFPTGELAKIAKITDFSLNWLLSGNGEKRTAKPVPPSIINEENLERLIREIVRSELAQHEESVVISPLRPTDIMLAPIIAHVGDEATEEGTRKTG